MEHTSEKLAVGPGGRGRGRRGECLGKSVIVRGVVAAVELWNYLTSFLEFFCIVLHKCCKCYERLARGPSSIQLWQTRSAVEAGGTWIQCAGRAPDDGPWHGGDGS